MLQLLPIAVVALAAFLIGRGVGRRDGRNQGFHEGSILGFIWGWRSRHHGQELPEDYINYEPPPGLLIPIVGYPKNPNWDASYHSPQDALADEYEDELRQMNAELIATKSPAGTGRQD